MTHDPVPPRNLTCCAALISWADAASPGPQQPQPERGPVPLALCALAGRGVEVELERAAWAEPGGRHGVGVTGEPVQRGRVRQHRGPVGQR
jgi:hypothetical protein